MKTDEERLADYDKLIAGYEELIAKYDVLIDKCDAFVQTAIATLLLMAGITIITVIWQVVQ